MSTIFNKGDKYVCESDGNTYEYFVTKKAEDKKTDLLVFKYVSRWDGKPKRMELKLEQFNNLIKVAIWQKQ